MQFSFAKRSSAADSLLLFMVTAAASVLLTRFYLFLFDYPQIARGHIHFAHIIFGGIFLSIGNILLLSMHGRRSRQFAAVVSGIGFGQFIDELGKFITQENNYFYQPVPMLIYLCFIFLFFLYRYFTEYTPLQPRELMYQILEEMEEVAEGRFFPATKKRILYWTEKLKLETKQQYQHFALGIENMVSQLNVASSPRPKQYVQKIKSSWMWLDEFTTERRPVFYILILIFVLYIGITSFGIGSFLFNLLNNNFDKLKFKAATSFDWFMVGGLFLSQFWSMLIMVRGVFYLIGRKRNRALALFRNGLAVNILVTQAFTFYFEQFSATIELLFILGLFAIIQNIIEDELE